MKNRKSRMLLIAATACLTAAAGGSVYAAGTVQGVSAVGKDGAEVAPESSTGVVAVVADNWAEEFPLQYDSYMKNSENDEQEDYLEENPYLKTLYNGYGFAIDYKSARGHSYCVTDLYATGRPHKLANCFTCKTIQFTSKVLSEGDSAYAMDFEDVKAEIGETAEDVSDPFGCFHCHENEPGKMYVTHGYLADALADDLSEVPAADLSCGQCHTEYYFNPKTKATTLGYHGLDGMNPQQILENENQIMDEDGNLFCDWVDEDTGTRKLKAQHPEFETFLGEGSVHAGTFTCADCHMGKSKAEDGTEYTNHKWTSPLDNKELLENTCSKCHTGDNDLTKMVPEIQKKTRDRENEIGDKLATLDEKLAAAVKEGKMSDGDLDEIRMLNRNSQFLWDFVFVENSEGAHNSKLTNETLDKAEEFCDQALEKLEG